MYSIEQLQKKQFTELRTDCKDSGWISESNILYNKISRSLIRAMKKEKGSCWIWTCNPYGNNKEVVKEYKQGMIYNFQGSFITPVYDPDLEKMMKERLSLPYTGTEEDSRKIEQIFNHAEKLGMIHLFWS